MNSSVDINIKYYVYGYIYCFLFKTEGFGDGLCVHPQIKETSVVSNR